MKKNKKHYDKYKKFDVVYADFGRNPWYGGIIRRGQDDGIPCKKGSEVPVTAVPCS